MLNKTGVSRGLVASFRRYLSWNRSHAAGAASAASASSTASTTSLPGQGGVGDTLAAVERVVRARRSFKLFDAERAINFDVLRGVLDATVCAPSGHNLQPWGAVVVHEPRQREALCAAALGQRQVLTAPVTVVFAGDTEAERYAPQALEIGLDSGAIRPAYGPRYLRNTYYYLHGGPQQSMAAIKSKLSAIYSRQTGVPLVSVPVSRRGYAWKQTMIPATTFVHLCTAAGWDTCMMEGIDEEAVKRVVGLPERFTVPVIVSVGYATPQEKQRVRTPRFAVRHLIRWGTYE